MIGAELHRDGAVAADRERGVGIPLHRGHEGLVAPGECRTPDIGEGRRLDEPVDDARDERLEPLRGGRLEQPERLLGARRQVELLDAVEEVGGQRRDVDLLLDRRGDLVADVRLHRRLLGERRERRDELVGVDELEARPRRDHGDGCEQQRDDHEHHGSHGAPPAAALARRRARGIRALDLRGDRLGPQRRVLGFELRDPGFEFRRPCIRHDRPLCSKPSAMTALRASSSMDESPVSG